MLAERLLQEGGNLPPTARDFVVALEESAYVQAVAASCAQEVVGGTHSCTRSLGIAFAWHVASLVVVAFVVAAASAVVAASEEGLFLLRHK